MSQSLAYGFLDESPNLSDKEIFFCVDIISTTEKTNKSLQTIIKRARKRIVKKKLKSLYELKFHVSDEKTREYVLKEIAKHDVKIVAFAVDKEGRRVEDTPENYGIVVGATVAEYLSVYPSLSLTFDKKYTSKKQQEEFVKTSQETVHKLAVQGAQIFYNTPADSNKDSVVQLADFVAGALNVKYNQQNSHYIDIIKEKIVVEKIVKWTELKKRIVNP